jgi:hypothetical protein
MIWIQLLLTHSIALVTLVVVGLAAAIGIAEAFIIVHLRLLPLMALLTISTRKVGSTSSSLVSKPAITGWDVGSGAGGVRGTVGRRRSVGRCRGAV